MKPLQKIENEAEIKSYWKYTDKVYVSCVCITFNQEKYIEDTLNGFLAQKTDYRFEIVIHDDCSTDKTRDILKEYQTRYPSLIRLILQEENQYSQGKQVAFLAMSYVQGDYIAFCEGDDFWVDEFKLDKQVKAMIRNPNINLCFTNAYQLKNSQYIKKYNYSTDKLVIPAPIYIEYGGGASATASLMLSKHIAQELYKWNHYTVVGDVFMQALGAMNGGALFLPDTTAVYRTLADNSWSKKNFKMDQQRKILHKLIDNYNSFNLYTENQVRASTDVYISRRFVEIIALSLKQKDFKCSVLTFIDSIKFKKANFIRGILSYKKFKRAINGTK